jgi:prohibitin 1
MSIDIPYLVILSVFAGIFLFVVLIVFSRKKIVRYFPGVAAWFGENAAVLLMFLLVFLILFVVIARSTIYAVPAGSVGVIWKRFQGGTDVDSSFKEGSLIMMPWDKLSIYSTRFQVINFKVDAISSEGLHVLTEVAVRFRLYPLKVPMMHKQVGEEYSERLIVPEASSWIRMGISQYTAEELYFIDRELIQKQILASVQQSMPLQAGAGAVKNSTSELLDLIFLQDVLIKSITLPKQVKQAIINKVNQHYLDQEYVIRLEVEKKEAQRKQIEGEGIARFQAEVSEGISETYLRWRGIEATRELATSHNAKVVVIGGGKNGLPIILNTEDAPIPKPAPASVDGPLIKDSVVKNIQAIPEFIQKDKTVN